jgi:hypothetical protein
LGQVQKVLVSELRETTSGSSSEAIQDLDEAITSHRGGLVGLPILLEEDVARLRER